MTADDGTDGGDSSRDTDDSDGYVHTPGAVDEDRGEVHTPEEPADERDGYVHTPGGAASEAGGDSRGYVHTPEGVERKGSEREEATAAADTTHDRPTDSTTTAQQSVGGTGEQDVVHPDAVEREFDWRGWILVGVLFVAFVVAPLTIYLVPPGAEHYFTVLIVMPLVPAILLAVVAVWATTRP